MIIYCFFQLKVPEEELPVDFAKTLDEIRKRRQGISNDYISGGHLDDYISGRYLSGVDPIDGEYLIRYSILDYIPHEFGKYLIFHKFVLHDRLSDSEWRCVYKSSPGEGIATGFIEKHELKIRGNDFGSVVSLYKRIRTNQAKIEAKFNY